MLARRVGLLCNSRHIVSTARPQTACNTFLPLCRNYALSRFENRRPGGGRTRQRLAPRDTQNLRNRRDSEDLNDWKYEIQSSMEQSPLWEASQRPPTSNPEEGLRLLLLENNSLYVTRSILCLY